MVSNTDLPSTSGLVLVVLAGLVFAVGCPDSDVRTGEVDDEDAGWLEDAEGECTDPLEECDGLCVDVTAHRDHCGGCNNECTDGEVCLDGECATSCPADQHDCDSACFDLETSPLHCGECDNGCGPGEVCTEGECETSCGEDLTECDGVCWNLDTARNHCGGCGNQCDDGEVCSQGSCETSCGGGLTECDGVCRDLNTDLNHCGGCDNPCDDGEVCTDGSCELDCPAGQNVCEDGCYDLDTSNDHCGACSNACDDGKICSSGSCEVSCGGGLTECDGVCRDLQTDLNHCGGCDNACDDGEVCSQGSCEVSCGGGLTECDGVCRDLDTDRDHCGLCSNACDDGEVCSGGNCETSCGGGLTECDGVCRDLQTDRNHCGECANECADGEVCSDGSCEVSCGLGLTECGGICTDIDTDPDHCGACDSECPPSFACVQGSCSHVDDYPATIDGVDLWLRADRGVDTTDGAVTAWEDDIDSDRTATQDDPGARPALMHDVLGGEPTVRFDGDSDVLHMENFSYPDEEFTHVFAFVPREHLDESSEPFRLYAGDDEQGAVEPYFAFNNEGDGTISVHLSNDDDSVASTTTDTWYEHHPYLVTFSWDGDDLLVYVDGQLENTVGASGTLDAQDGFELGAFEDDEHFEGDLAEMMIFDQALGASQLEALHHYAFARYHFFFEGADWPAQYSDELQNDIEQFGLSEAEIESGRLQNIGPEPTCADHHDEGRTISGLYTLEPSDADPFVAYCDQDTDGGGWTLVGDYRSDAELFDFDHRIHQLQNDDGGADLDDPPLLGLGDRWGHIAYDTFEPADQTLRMECRPGADAAWFSETTELFDDWTIGDRPEYADDTWGIIGGDDHGRSNHFICGHKLNDTGRYAGIGLCEGPGESGEWHNHVVSFSFNWEEDQYTGGVSIGCDGSGYNDGKDVEWRGRLWTR